MLPFVCGSRNLRHIRSVLKVSSNIRRRNLIARAQVKSVRLICAAEIFNAKWVNNICGTQEAQNKNEARMFNTYQYKLASLCGSITLLESDGTVINVEVSGDDDEVTSSAGKKRKHWKTCSNKG